MVNVNDKKIGVLITHGTDTLAWTLPYVRYAIKNNHSNICLTGSQIPLPATAAFSDAFVNIQNSIRFLSTLRAPQIFAVFNYGRSAFSDSLRKIDKWDCIAFTGDDYASMKYGSIKLRDTNVDVENPFLLDKLHVISTGGTIDSEPDKFGILSPGANHALGYITTNFSNYFRVLSRDPVFSVDSSDMTLKLMKQLAEKTVLCLNEVYPDTYADTAFEEEVRILYTDPFKTTQVYMDEAEGAKGIVVAGYGGGNVNIDQNSQNSILPFIEKCTEENRIVVLTSQVPLGTTDFIYRNASEALAKGAISAVDLSIPEAQLRLSYIMGHSETIQEYAKTRSVAGTEIAKRVFLSGVKFRNCFSRNLFEQLTGINPIETDLLINQPFKDAIEQIQN